MDRRDKTLLVIALASATALIIISIITDSPLLVECGVNTEC